MVDSLVALLSRSSSVTVNVDKYASNRVIVIGSVQHPGVLYFDDTPTLLDVIAEEGCSPAPVADQATRRAEGMEFRSDALSTAATTKWFGSI